MQILDCDDANSVVGVGNGGARGLTKPHQLSQPTAPSATTTTISITPIRVVLVDDQELNQDIYKQAIESLSQHTIEVVGTATSTAQLLAGLAHWQPQVVVMDSDTPLG